MARNEITFYARITIPDEEAALHFMLLDQYCKLNRADADFMPAMGCLKCIFYNKETGFCKFKNQILGSEGITNGEAQKEEHGKAPEEEEEPGTEVNR